MWPAPRKLWGLGAPELDFFYNNVKDIFLRIVHFKKQFRTTRRYS